MKTTECGAEPGLTVGSTSRLVLDCSSRLSVSSPDRAAGSWNSLRPGLGSGSGLDWGWILRGSGLQQEVQPVINSQFDSSGFSSLCLSFSLCNLLNWSHLRGRTLSSLHLPRSILYTSPLPFPFLSFPFLPSLVLSCPVLSFQSFPVLSCPVPSFPFIPSPFLSFPFLSVLSFPFLSFPFLSFPFLSFPFFSFLFF